MKDQKLNKIYQGNAKEILKTWPDEFVDCVITSPPYWGLRDYGVSGQLGLEKTPEEYVAKMVEVFREVKRVLKKEGTCWLNLGDSYAGSGNPQQGKHGYKDGRCNRVFRTSLPYRSETVKPKDLVGIPWRIAFALQADGWYLRQDIIWHKPNPMPESVTDRCTKAHEYVFLLAKSQKYYFNQEAIFEPANYDGRKDTMMKGSRKYKDGFVPNQSPQTFHERGHERWRWREEANCKDDKRAGKGRIHYAGKREGQEGTGQENFVSIKAYRNRRSVWTINVKGFKEAHFATFPEDLISPMVLAGCPKEGIVLDPFIGSGTTAVVAKKLKRKWLGIELNQEYIKMAENRIKGTPEPLL